MDIIREVIIMTEKAQRAKDGEKIKADLLDEKKLKTILKRFLGSKSADPEITKYYRIENGIHYMATTLGSAVSIYFKNKHDGTFTSGTGQSFFRKPLPNDKHEDVQAIAELEEIAEGKKKIKVPTGNYYDYPDIAGIFDKFDLKEFQEVEIPIDDVDQFIAVHEAMEKAAKVGGIYNTAVISITGTFIGIELYDSPLEFSWSYDYEQAGDLDFCIANYYYDFSNMVAIFKSLKDLKPDRIKMYVKDKNTPILFIGETVEYNFNFAIQRKLVR
jgi:hypothetical protein